MALGIFPECGRYEKSLKCLNQMENQTLAVNLKRLIKAYEKTKSAGRGRKICSKSCYLENEWKERSMQSEEEKTGNGA